MKLPPKPYRDLARKAIEQGWDVSQRRTGHWQWKAPDKVTLITVAAKPNQDPRTYKNVMADLKKAGFVL